MVTKKELLETLNGEEILSTYFEGCVLVKDGQIIQYGEVIDPNPTRKTLGILLDEAVVYMFGGRENLSRMMEEEFGEQ